STPPYRARNREGSRASRPSRSRSTPPPSPPPRKGPPRRKRWSPSAANERGAAPSSRIEALRPPAGALAVINDAVVQPVWAVLPGLEPTRRAAEAGPGRRARHLPALVAPFELGDARLEHGALRQRARLLRCPGADLRKPRPGREIGVRLFRRDRARLSLDAHLAEQAFPVEAERGMGIRQQLLTLPALEVGIEDEAAALYSLQQHDPARRPPLGIDRRQRHGVGVGRLRFPRLVEPGLELRERLLQRDDGHT